MKKSIAWYGLAVGVGAALLQWMEYQYVVRVFSTEIYVALIALLFAAMGVWVGLRLATRHSDTAFAKNSKAIAYLGISDREYEVLGLLARGHSNREIAKELFVSTNTIKSHLARLYEKLEVSRRTQAIQKARTLGMIP